MLHLKFTTTMVHGHLVTFSSEYGSMTSSSAIRWAGSSLSPWISKSSSGIVSQCPRWAAIIWTSSYCSGSARLIRVCVPCVKRIRRLLQFSSLLILVVGSSFSPSSMLSNWHLALQFWPRIRRQGCQLTVRWRCSSSWRGKEMKFCPKIKGRLN